MGKSLLSSENLKRLNNLKSDLVFKDGNDLIEIKQTISSKTESFDTKYNIYKNGHSIFEKSEGYSGGGWCNWDYEEYHYISSQNIIVSNDLKSYTDNYDITYFGPNYKLFDNKNSIYFDNAYFVLKEDFIDEFNGTYYDPKCDKVGIFIGETRYVVDIKNNIRNQILDIIENHNSNAKQIEKQIFDILSKNIIDKNSLKEGNYYNETLTNLLKKLLQVDNSQKTIDSMVNSIDVIKKAYQTFVECKSKKQEFQSEINDLNAMLERCFKYYNKYIAKYKKELQEMQKSLKKKYEKNKRIRIK